MSSKLTSLQQRILNAFFDVEDRFFLTGGAALSGFYLEHRETHDLDLFTQSDALNAGVALVYQIAKQFGAAIESLQTSPDFHRLLFRLGSESVVIDLARDRVEQAIPTKLVIRGIKVDPPEEILANKLCTLLSRSEIRDLVDVRALELAGYRVEDSIAAAAAKDSGLTPAQLGWVLSEMKLGEDASPPGGVSVAELNRYLSDLSARLARMAFPA